MGYPYTMTYTVNSGDTILADHINTSNQEHIDNNIPENIDDYSATSAEMKTVTSPLTGSSPSLATSLSEELERIRYQISELAKRFNPSHAQWFSPVGQISAILLTFEPGATPGTNINVTVGGNTRGFNKPTITNATDLAKSGTSGSFSLNSLGQILTMDITEVITGVLSATIEVHDVTSTNELYVATDINSDNVRFTFRERSSTTASDMTSVLAAGKKLEIKVLFLTDS